METHKITQQSNPDIWAMLQPPEEPRLTYKQAAALHKDPQQAFEEAIAAGRLSTDPQAENYAGHYMYMGIANDGVRDAFKHSLTREYIS